MFLRKDIGMKYSEGIKGAVKKFFEVNKSLVYLLPVLVVLLVVLIIVLSGQGNKSIDTSGKKDDFYTGDNLPKEPQVDVLPQFKRTESSVNVDKDPFGEPMKLTGIVLSDNKPVAIIVADGYSYVAGIDDIVGEKSWKVVCIEKDSVTLKSNEESITLNLSSTK